MPTWNRFEIIEAWDLALSHTHGGQNSTAYRRLCRMTRHFRPSPMLSFRSLTENGRQISGAALRRLRGEGAGA
jgi:hypothetical protein